MSKREQIECLINSFDYKQTVILPSGIKQYLSIEELKTSLPAICYSENVFNIHFFGNREYINNIIEDVKEQERILFSQNNNIKMEVN